MEIHDPNIINTISLAGNNGQPYEAIISQGLGLPALWSPVPREPLYAYTDKFGLVQALVGAVDVTWNNPFTMNGVTFNGTTSFTLPAGRIYKLTANITPTVAATAYSLTWVDSLNNAVGFPNQPANGLANLAHVHAFCILETVLATTVKLRNTGANVTLGSVCTVFIETVD